MNTNRKFAVVAGVLFIIATVRTLIRAGTPPTDFLSDPVYLTKISANEDQVLWGVFFLFIGGAGCPAIAIALYPVFRSHNEGLALGSVGFRLIEGTLYVCRRCRPAGAGDVEPGDSRTQELRPHRPTRCRGRR